MNDEVIYRQEKNTIRTRQNNTNKLNISYISELREAFEFDVILF